MTRPVRLAEQTGNLEQVPVDFSEGTFYYF